MKRWWTPCVVMAVVLVAGGVSYWRMFTPAPEPDPAPASPWFSDITDDVGLDFVHDAGPIDDRYFMPQIVGSGGALFDCDGDGLLDIYLVNNGGPKGRPNALYQQIPGGKFRDISRGSGLDFAGYGMGVAIGDVDNDGLPDVLVAEYGRIRLCLNKGGGRFEPVDAACGLDSSLWGTSACFVDYDKDGWLDVVVVNYVAYDPGWLCKNADGSRDYCHPNVFPGAVAKLFRNITGVPKATGGAGKVRFEDTTVASGLARLPGPGLGVTCADFNGDGWPDVFVANDAQANRLWINQTDGTFKDEAVTRGVAYDAYGRALANMGVALGDTHGDGHFDLFVTHLPEETNTLWRQKPRGQFVECTATSGLLEARWRATGFGTVLADFNHDGVLDLAIANGRVVRTRNPVGSTHWDAYADQNQLFAGAGPGKFKDISRGNAALCAQPNVARGLAVGDIDGDGALDLLVTCAGARARLLRNVAPERGHWLVVRAIDPVLKRDAYGTAVTVEASGRNRVAWINPGQSYLCSNEAHAHFGIGASTAIDAIRVLWPDGTEERFPGGRVNRVVQLRKGEGTVLSRPVDFPRKQAMP